jgi:hypothetical protein
MYWREPLSETRRPDSSPAFFCFSSDRMEKTDMMKKVPKDGLRKPMRYTAETRAEITKKISQDLAKAEADTRNAKTEKLRKARLEMEAREAGSDLEDTAAKKSGRSRK